MTVYIVTRGYYSEYEIVAVFDDEAKAEAYIDGSIAHQDLRPLDGWRIEPMEVNATEPTPDKRVPRFKVVMKRDGTTRNIKLIGAYPPLWMDVEWVPLIGDPKGTFVRTEEGRVSDIQFVGYEQKEKMMRAWVSAQSEEAAIKIVNDRRLQLLANDEWPEVDEAYVKNPTRHY